MVPPLMDFLVSADLAASGAPAETCQQRAVAHLKAMLPKTRALFAHDKRAARLIDFASAVPSLHFGIGFERSDKARLWDFDGNSYLDFSMGAGAYLLGHQAPPLVKAFLEAGENAAPRLSPSLFAAPLAEQLSAAIPAMEQILFLPDPAQAFSTALGIAALHSGKSGVGIAYGGDWPPPLPSELMVTARHFFYRDPEAPEKLESLSDSIGILLLAPIDPFSPDSHDSAVEWLNAMAAVCRKKDIIFLLDERLTGLRLALGGAQEKFGLSPDLVVMGRLAPGLPLAALGGARHVMERIKRRQAIVPLYWHDRAPLGEMADLNIPLAVAHAYVSTLREAAGRFYPVLEEESARLHQLINDFTDANQIPLKLRRAGSIFRFEGEGILLRDLTPHLLVRGVYWPADQVAFLSGAHTPDDIDAAALAIEQSMLDMRMDHRF